MSNENDGSANSTGAQILDFFKNPFAMAMMGFVLGVGFTWFSMVWPLTKQLEAREASLEEWARINREEQQAISDIKGMSTEELRKWVATLDEQNVRFAQLQSAIHRQELALSGPAYGYMLIALVAVLGAGGLLVWLSRDTNADAARTFENAASVLPSLRKAVRDGQRKQLGEGQDEEPLE